MECLVTKLKATVNDDSLPVLGALTFIKRAMSGQTAVNNAYVEMVVSEICELKVVEGSGFYTDNTVTTIDPNKVKTIYPPGTNYLYVAPGTKLRLTPKYPLTKLLLNAAELNVEELAYINELTNVSATLYAKGNIGVVDMSSYKFISFSNSSDVFGDIAQCKLSSALTHINISDTSIEGDIADAFGACTNLGTLTISRINITGTIESFVEAQRANGRTSGSVKIPYVGECSALTYNGVRLATNPPVTSGINNTLNWTDSTITWS